jgi:UDP-glucose 4-epimerase
MARYLVTGGCGFIGSRLIAALKAEGHAVRVLDERADQVKTHEASPSMHFTGDVARLSDVQGVISDCDGCFHLAAVSSVQRANEAWPWTTETNCLGTVNVLDAAARCSPPVPVVYASSAAVYGDPTTLPADENTPLAPQSAYGVDKFASELHAKVGAEIHGVPTLGLRLFNVYGPGQDPASPYSGVISIFADRLAKGLDIPIHGDGSQARDFVFVDDVVAHLKQAMAQLTGGAHVYNVCSGRPTTVRELAEIMIEISCQPANLRFEAKRSGDIARSYGDPSRARRDLGTACATDLGGGLAQTYAWCLAQVGDCPRALAK